MYKILEKVLAILLFLSTNETWKSIKAYIGSFFTKKKKEETIMAYPQTLPLESIKYVVEAIRTKTVNKSVQDFVYHLVQVLEYLLKVSVGNPTGVVTEFSDEVLDTEALADLFELESFEPEFTGDEAGIDPVTIITIVTMIFNLLKSLGIIKKVKTTDVLD